MSLFKKRAKDGLPDPNGPLSSRVAATLGGQERWLRGLASNEYLMHGKKKRGPYYR